jgi:hypothetical protein
VTIPSDLAIGETLDLGRWVHETLGRDLDSVVVNRCESHGFAQPDLAALKAAGGGTIPAEAVAVAEAATRRATLHDGLADDLEDGLDCRIVRLPELPAGTPSRTLAERLSLILASALG